MKEKLRSQKAETLIEALLSFLIVMLSLALLSTSVISAANINKETRKLDEKYSNELQVAEGHVEDGYTSEKIDLEIHFEKGIGVSERVKEVKVKLFGEKDSAFVSYQYEEVSGP
ncbi:MAG: hypothetical protein IJO60_00070 [Agathobacter sp.]|nr:hypothetical protein [Agathobacter sp.]